MHSSLLATVGGEARIHRDLSEIFSAEKQVIKSLQLKDASGSLLQKIEKASRGVTLQPLHPRNIRRLRAQPYHMIRSGSYEKMASTLKTRLLCNFRFLQTKLRACGVRQLVEDFLSLERTDTDLVAVSDALQTLLRHKTEDERVAMLSHTLIESLAEGSSKSKYLKLLVSQAKLANK